MSHQTMIKIDSVLRDKIKRIAKKEGYTLQGYFEKIVKQYLQTKA